MSESFLVQSLIFDGYGMKKDAREKGGGGARIGGGVAGCGNNMTLAVVSIYRILPYWTLF